MSKHSNTVLQGENESLCIPPQDKLKNIKHLAAFFQTSASVATVTVAATVTDDGAVVADDDDDDGSSKSHQSRLDGELVIVMLPVILGAIVAASVAREASRQSRSWLGAAKDLGRLKRRIGLDFKGWSRLCCLVAWSEIPSDRALDS